MSRRYVLMLVMLGMVCCVGAPRARAQSDNPQRTAGYSAILDNLDLLVDNYAGFLARKYDLTPEQDEYTRHLLRERADEFFSKHQENLRGLIDRLFDVRSGGQMTQQELIEWGREVQPIYDDAKQVIIEGNNEWREILTDDQKKIHDEDLRMMYESFDSTEEKLGRILSGEMTVDEFRSPQRSRPSSTRARSSPFL